MQKKSKITIQKNGNGAIFYNLRPDAQYLQDMGITDQNRTVIQEYDPVSKKLIIYLDQSTKKWLAVQAIETWPS